MDVPIKNIKLLAISGSLRNKSSNSAVLQAIKTLAPASVDVSLYLGLDRLPHFNQDLDKEPLPEEIISLRKQIKESDGILISSPEYAHGVPGSLKNALDWLVSSVEFPGKPVALINTNPRATIGFASLKEILTTMSAKIFESSNLTLDITGRKLDTQGIVMNPELSTFLKKMIAIYTQNIYD